MRHHSQALELYFGDTKGLFFLRSVILYIFGLLLQLIGQIYPWA